MPIASMRSSRQSRPVKLEDLPNIGKSIAADLRGIGILYPHQLAERDPLALYTELAGAMGPRHDPCVLYTLMAAKHFLESGEALPWWKFTAQGKQLLASKPGSGERAGAGGRS
ncbi:MAG TPA: helix-hairpin-helix domain-containing protein [Dongiaceae bacterium]|nr:helix-hairpin-helix domain-containing protein [Dongiaceae bacterium]